MDDFWTWFAILMGGGSVVIAIGAVIVTALCTIIPFALVGWWVYSRAQQRDVVRQSAVAWQTTTGRVLMSQVERHGGRHRTIRPVVVYAYDINGRTYQSSQIRAGDKFLRVTGGQDAVATVNRYPAGAIVQIYYDPANPQEAALERQ